MDLINWLVSTILFDALNNWLCQLFCLIKEQLQMQIANSLRHCTSWVRPNIRARTSSYHNNRISTLSSKLLKIRERSVADTIKTNKKYILWNEYLPNAVAFNTSLSKYLTVTVMTELRRFKVIQDQRSWCQSKVHWWFPKWLPLCPTLYHHFRDIWH